MNTIRDQLKAYPINAKEIRRQEQAELRIQALQSNDKQSEHSIAAIQRRETQLQAYQMFRAL